MAKNKDTKRSKPKTPKSSGKQWPKIIVHRTVDKKKAKLHVLETATHLRTFVEYQQSSHAPIGAILLNTSSLNDPEYRVRFVLKFSGSHDYQDAIQAESSISAITALIREIPQGESLRVYWQCFPDTTDRELELADTFHAMYENPDYQSEHCSRMLVEEIQILRDGHEKGRRKQQHIYLAVTYTARTQGIEKDGLEKVIDFFGSAPKKFFGKVSGSAKLLAEESLDRFLLKAYEAGYLYWTTLIRERLQIAFEPLDAEGVWQFCRAESNKFNDRQLRINAITNGLQYQKPTIPHLIQYDLTNAEISEISHSTLHPTSLLHQESTSIPATGRDYVYLDGKYIACLYLKAQPTSFDANGRQTLEQVQLLYMWDILSKPFCYDFQVVLEASIVDQLAVNINNQDLITQAAQQLKDAESKGRIDVRAQMHLDEAIETQRSIVSGDPTMDFALTVYIYRDTISDMRSAVNQFRQCFRAPATMLQDVDTCDAIWVQSLPYYGKSLLVDTRDRRDRTRAVILASYMPMLLPQSPHKKGMEFIAIKGGTPIYFDPFEAANQGHIALWAKTRSGKSVLAGWFICRALVDGVKTTIIDQPPSAEASTFKDFVHRLNGGYVDILVDALNPFQLPNIPAEASQAHRDDLRQESQIYLLRTLTAMVLGDIKETTPHTKRVEGFLPVILKKFFENDQIKLRYVRAREGGINSAAWQEHPILEDYVQFCEVSHIGLTDGTIEDLETMGYIRNQLRKWTSGQHARVLNSPSTVEIDQLPLLAIAMRGISGNDEAAVFGSLIYLVAMRRAIAASASPKGSLLFIDEAARTLGIKPVCDAVAAAMVNGLKARMRVMLASQEPGSIANSFNGDQIMDALTYHLIGRIGTESLAAYDKYLNLPYEIAVMNAGDSFAPDRATNSSRWIFKSFDRFTPVTAYLPPSLVALTANNVEERLERRALSLAEETTSALSVN
jgi:hypothetical protein